MKKEKSIKKKEYNTAAKLLILFSVVCCMLGCQDVFVQPEEILVVDSPEGMGAFLLYIENDMRTILPDVGLAENAIKSYKLIFTKTGEAGKDETFPLTKAEFDALDTEPVFLLKGVYELEIIAYKNADFTGPIAHGSPDPNEVVIEEGEVTPCSVTLHAYAIVEDETGIFSWNITFENDFDTELTAATMKITGGATDKEINLKDRPLVSDDELDTGYYQVTFTLKRNFHNDFVWDEILHVYQNMTSHFNHTFYESDLNKTRYTVTFDYNDSATLKTQTRPYGSLATAPTPAPVLDGWDFGGWYKDGNFDGDEWDFDYDIIIENTTLAAKWNKKPITAATIIVEAPENGVTAVTTAPAGTTQYTCSTITWLQYDGDDFIPMVGTVFLSNTTYAARVTLTANSNYTFIGIDIEDVTVNGEEASDIESIGDNIIITYYFTATGEKTVTGIAIKEQPNTTYTHGQTLNLSALVVTLTYNDTTTEDVSFASFATNTPAITAVITDTSTGHGSTLVRESHNGKTITVGCNGFFTTTNALNIARATGAEVTGPIIENEVTYYSITVQPVSAPANQTVEYKLHDETGLVKDWQDELTFTGLEPNTEYYVYARAKENTNYLAGDPIVSDVITTETRPAFVIEVTIGDTETGSWADGTPLSDGKLAVPLDEDVTISLGAISDKTYTNIQWRLNGSTIVGSGQTSTELTFKLTNNGFDEFDKGTAIPLSVSFRIDNVPYSLTLMLLINE